VHSQAYPAIRELIQYDVMVLEEPLFPPEDFQTLADIRRATGIPIALGENICAAFDFQKVFSAKTAA